MPHIVIEHSTSLTRHITPQFLEDVRSILKQSSLFNPEAIKARAVEYSTIALEEKAQTFMHVTISILSNRTLKERQIISRDVFDGIQKIIPNVEKLSVNIHEMNGDTYTK